MVYFCSFCKFIPCLYIVQPFIGLLRSKTQDALRQESTNPGLQHSTRLWPIRKWAVGRCTCVCVHRLTGASGGPAHTCAYTFALGRHSNESSCMRACVHWTAACVAWFPSFPPLPKPGCQTAKVGGCCSKTYSPNKLT